jgi:hypothetical protein
MAISGSATETGEPFLVGAIVFSRVERIICPMIRCNVATILYPLLLITIAVAQTVQSRQLPPKIKIVFAEGVPYGKIWLEYDLSGPGVQHRKVGLGGPSRAFGNVPSGAPFYEIEASVDGYAADRFKALVWAPGCKMKEFDIALSTSSVELPYACDKLKSVTLVGRVQQVDWGVQSVVSVQYVSPLGGFFSVCKVACRVGNGIFISIPEIATADVGTDGTFEIKLPDFSDDPVTSRVSAGAAFEFVLNDTVLSPGHSNYRHISLEPELEDLHGPMAGLRIAQSYPSDLIFVPRR